MAQQTNRDQDTIDGFGAEWAAFDQTAMSADEHEAIASNYFRIFPFGHLPRDAEGFDLGCGSGRWAAWVLPKVGRLHCIDPAPAALAVARRRLGDDPRVVFHNDGADTIPLAEDSQDFGYSLGVLHHIPDPAAGMRECVRRLKPGAPFLVYLYYRFDNRPAWFRALWQASNVMRYGISRLPFGLRKGVTNVLATAIYWPLARTAAVVERLGTNVSVFPLSHYRHKSFYTMRTDALDRFGTQLEQRYTRDEIERMMRHSGLTDVVFNDGDPYWIACGVRAH